MRSLSTEEVPLTVSLHGPPTPGSETGLEDRRDLVAKSRERRIEVDTSAKKYS